MDNPRNLPPVVPNGLCKLVQLLGRALILAVQLPPALSLTFTCPVPVPKIPSQYAEPAEMAGLEAKLAEFQLPLLGEEMVAVASSEPG